MLHGRLENVPEMDAESVLKIELANRSRILALPGSQGGKTIRGLGNARLVLVAPATAFEGKTARGNLGWWWLRVRGRHGP
jgi:hypothetical protein